MKEKPSQKTPDYDFSRGLHMTIEDISSGQERKFSLSPEEVRNIPTGRDSDALSAEVYEKMTNPIKHKIGKKVVEMVFLGPDTGSARVVNYGWGGQYPQSGCLG